jgi:8-oxo-dGTP diphosphatase
MVMRPEHGRPRATCPACGFIHYRNPVPAAGVILTGPEGVLLVKRAVDPAAGAWCLPAGFMEHGETAPHCALRELREETGIVARLTGLFGVYAGIYGQQARTVLILYRAERTGGRLKPGDDAVEARYFGLSRLPRRIAFKSHRRALAEHRRVADLAARTAVTRTVPRRSIRRATKYAWPGTGRAS